MEKVSDSHAIRFFFPAIGMAVAVVACGTRSIHATIKIPTESIA
jgi:hypothetical protein